MKSISNQINIQYSFVSKFNKTDSFFNLQNKVKEREWWETTVEIKRLACYLFLTCILHRETAPIINPFKNPYVQIV